MKKVFLTRHVPERGAGIDVYKSLPEDAKQKMLAHQNDELQMQNFPPSVRMTPLAKYQTTKWAKTIPTMPTTAGTAENEKNL